MAANNLSEPILASSMLCYSYEGSWDRCLEKDILTLWKGKVEVLRSHFFSAALMVSYQTGIWLQNYDG